MLTSEEWIVIGQIITFLTAALAFIQSRLNNRLGKETRSELTASVQKIEVAVDGRLSQLLALTATSSHAEGRIEGIAVNAVPDMVIKPANP